MPRPSLADFAPRWVLVIYFLSLCEAIGLTIYFHANLADPETASMRPAYLESKSIDTITAVEGKCVADTLGAPKPIASAERKRACTPRSAQNKIGSFGMLKAGIRSQGRPRMTASIYSGFNINSWRQIS